MSQINIRNLSNENDDGSPEIVGVSTFSATSYFVPPKGTTAESPSDCEPGSIRFNTDTANLEYFRGNTIGWVQFELVTPNLGGGTGSNTGFGVRGLIMGGFGSPDTTREEIEFITISTLGDTQDFGDLTQGSQAAFSGLGNRTNAFYAGGSQVPAGLNVIQKITVASLGNAVDYGDTTVGNRAGGAGLSNTTRAILAGGNVGSPASNVIEYFSMMQSGNSIDFGDLSGAGEGLEGSVNSSTRGLIYGVGSYGANTIEFITVSSTGNSTDFGDLIQGVGDAAGGCNSTRGIIGGGLGPSPVNQTNIIQFVTIASLGNTQDFGDLTQKRNGFGAMSSSTRTVFAGGSVFPTHYNIMDFIEIATTGNAVDFGDITGDSGEVFHSNAVSNGHGGL